MAVLVRGLASQLLDLSPRGPLAAPHRFFPTLLWILNQLGLPAP